MKPFVAKMPLHKAPDKTDIEEEAGDDVVYNSVQRPQRYGERADSFENDQYEEVPQADDKKECPKKDKERMDSNVDSIAEAIMEAIDAVDEDEKTKIKTIFIEIGLE